MATLAGNTIASTYPLLLKIDSSGIDGTLRAVEDGDGTDSALSIATDSVLIKGSGVKLYFHDADGGEYISGDGTDLTIAAGTALNITADVIDLSDATKDVTLNAAVDALNFDSNTLSIDASNNRVGIGTAAPTNPLEVAVGAADESVRLSCYSTTDAHHGALLFTKSGNATIGTAAATAAGETLGSIVAQGHHTGNTVKAAASIKFQGDAAPDGDSVPGRIIFSTSDADDAGSPTERMRIDDGGNVGIGTNAPSNDFVVSDNAAATGNGMEFGAGASSSTIDVFNRSTSSYTPLSITASTLTVDPQTAVGLTVNAADEADAIITNGADGGRYDVLTVKEATNARWRLSFEGTGSENSLTLFSNTKDGDDANDNVMAWNNAQGFVGIGTNAQKKMLHIERGDTDCMIILDSSNSASDKQICFAEDYVGGNETGGDYWGVGVDASEGPDFVIAFDANAQASMGGDDDKMRISSGGCVGIGTSTHGDIGDATGVLIQGGSSQTSMKFQVKDTDTTVDSNNVIGQMAFSGDDNADAGKFFEFADSGGVIGSISANGAGNTAFNTSSDERLKKDIEDVSDSLLDEINKIKVRKFQWNHRPANFHIGLIAQELEKIVPKAVNKGGDDPKKQPYSVAYSSLVPYLIKAVQELSAKVTALENA